MKPSFYAKQKYPIDPEKQEIAKLAFKAGYTESIDEIDRLKEEIKKLKDK